jgi:LPS export ABC transporter protein LptC
MRSAAQRARLLIQRGLTAVAVLAGGAVLFALFGGPQDDDVETDAGKDERGYYVTDATLTELDAAGKPRVVVRARSIEQQLDDESVRLEHLEMDYTTERAGEWHLTADRGRMPSDQATLQLQGNVRVSGAPEASGHRALILTDELAYDTAANVVHTAAPVAVQFGTHKLEGRGLRVALNAGTLRLESNVDGTFTP